MRNILITIYILTVLLISVASKASIHTDNDFSLPVETQSYIGRLAYVEDEFGHESYVLAINENEYVNLQTSMAQNKPGINLKQFVGHDVIIQGIELVFKPANFDESNALDPLPGVEENKNAPIVLVRSVNYLQ